MVDFLENYVQCSRVHNFSVMVELREIKISLSDS